MALLRTSVSTDASFSEWVRVSEPRIRVALTASFGPEIAADATGDAMEIVWTRWAEVGRRNNPDAYVYGIARNRARRLSGRRPINLPSVSPDEMPHVEPGLPAALGKLTERQRSVVGLVHGHGWTLSQVASLLGLSKTSVQNHAERGLSRLRHELGVEL